MNTPEPTLIPSLRCTKCKYNLTGIDPSSNCPECGTPLLEHCINCQYSLVGTSHDSVCPECGLEAKYSLTQGPFIFVSEEKRHSILLGFRMIGISFALFSVLIVFPIMFYEFASAVFVFLGLAIYVSSSIGWWKLTVQLDEVASILIDEAHRKHVRRSIFFLACFLLILLIWIFFLPVLEDVLSKDMIKNLFIVYVLMSIPAGAYYYFSRMNYLINFARLLKRKVLKRGVTQFKWAAPFVALVICAVGPFCVSIIYMVILYKFHRGIKATLPS